MPSLNITPEEKEILTEILEDYLSDLRMEIADTDNAAFKEKLKMRKELLNKILTELNK